MKNKELIRSILFGVCVGDSIGLPVQFKERYEVKQKPVTNLHGYGTFNLPPGHWTDDSSLTFCLAESIAEGYSPEKLAAKFVKWLFEGYWSSQEKAYDIGMSSYKAIGRLRKGINPMVAGGEKESDNGNGSLMRILPLVLLTKDLEIEDRFKLTQEVSSLTHRHIRAVIACFYYLEIAKLLLEGESKEKAYTMLQQSIPKFLESKSIEADEISLYKRLLLEDISLLEEDAIRSYGYVVDTLEASIWCFLTTDNYKDCVLKAANLGHDTDTVAAIAGGLSAIYYGFESIPKEWVEQIVKKDKIEALADNLEDIYG